ncbi:HTH-type transcriptional activator RhaR [bioreactor metagenome]|uniref:HTH-type transcriptional activator RhaR n=1 Tax=bioreactor metagenome TaxID=1076179 RepID=A0A645ICI7_9ZZZZ
MPPNHRSRIRLLLLELLILLARKAGTRLRHRGSEAVCEYVDHLIGQYFREEFKLETVAHKTGIDKSRLCRLYRAGSGKTVMEALRLRRLREAAELLAHTDRTVSEICFGCGFNDLSYFYRAFTSEFAMNPGEFRRRRNKANCAGSAEFPVRGL